jgi:hypothetical protein
MGRKIPQQREDSRKHLEQARRQTPERLLERLAGKGIHVPINSRIVFDALAGQNTAMDHYLSTK